VEGMHLMCLALAFAIGFVTAWLMRNFSWGDRLREVESRLHGCERDLNASVARCRGLDGEIKSLQRVLDEAQGQLKLKDEELKRYALDLNRLDEDLAQANEQRGALERKLVDAQTVLNARASELERYKAEQGAQQARLLKLEADVNQRGSALSAARDEALKLEADLKQLREEQRAQLETLERERDRALDLHARDLKGWESKFSEMAALIKAAPKSARKPLDLKRAAATDKPPRVYDVPPADIDNLEDIHGVGPKLAQLLNTLGVYQFRQIASWDAEDIAWFDARLEQFHGRIERESWVASAAECERMKR
jgi:predicted flap endonuclease-1-like 5' DNA nuclease